MSTKNTKKEKETKNKSTAKKNQTASSNKKQNNKKINNTASEKTNTNEKRQTKVAVEKNSKIKANKPEKESPAKKDSNELIKLLKIVAIVTGIIILIYIITMISTRMANDQITKEKREQNKQAAVIQYDDIMIGTMLNKEGTYYVLIKKDKDNRITEYDALINTAKSSNRDIKFYTANLNDSFNKSYLGKESNTKPEKIENFKVKETTLVKVVDHKIDSAYENYDAIKNKLKELK